MPGRLVHVDVKKIGRIPDGGGYRVHGRGSDGHRASKRGQRPGYAYLHSAIDDRSRLAYTEELADEKSVTAAGFWERAEEFFAAHGIDDIHRVLTDNGSCYRVGGVQPGVWPPATSSTASPGPTGRRRTGRSSGTSGPWPANGPTSGPSSSNDDRAAALPAFLHRYNYHRPHTALRGLTPVMRTTTVINLSGFNN